MWIKVKIFLILMQIIIQIEVQKEKKNPQEPLK